MTKKKDKAHPFAFVYWACSFYFVENSRLLLFFQPLSTFYSHPRIHPPFRPVLNFPPFASSRKRNASTFFPKRIVLLFHAAADTMVDLSRVYVGIGYL